MKQMGDSETLRDAMKKPIILREYEFFGGCIRAKISVKNMSDAAILDDTRVWRAKNQGGGVQFKSIGGNIV